MSFLDPDKPLNGDAARSDFVKLPCQHCRATLEVARPSNIIVLNGIEASTVIVPHAQPILCPGCHSVYQVIEAAECP